MSTEYNYVWYNANTGEFSNSWYELTNQRYVKEEGWVLIKYQCITDDNFKFNKKTIDV